MCLKLYRLLLKGRGERAPKGGWGGGESLKAKGIEEGSDTPVNTGFPDWKMFPGKRRVREEQLVTDMRKILLLGK